MDRIIKFRGKRLDNGEWVKGFYLCFKRNADKDKKHYIQSVEDNGDLGFIHEVNPSTVGQFTGLCDKNGVEIYEGDRINPIYVTPIGLPTEDYDTDKEFVVVFENGIFAFSKPNRNNISIDKYIRHKNGEYISNYGNLRIAESNIVECKVIGSIYDEVSP